MNIENLWIKYSETRDIETKKELIENYIDLVKIMAGRMYNFYGSKIEYDDLVGYGVLGLIDSINKFDINKNIKFETYAQIRIRGSIIDSIRKLDWIPRSLRKKSKDVQNAISFLENKMGRSPTNFEIAEQLEINIEDLELLLSDISVFNITSLDDILKDNNENPIKDFNESNKPEQAYEEKEIKNLLAKSIDSLSENEKLVVSLYYYDELTYKEIGKTIDLSESRISQIHSKAIIKMKSFLKKQGIE